MRMRRLATVMVLGLAMGLAGTGCGGGEESLSEEQQQRVEVARHATNPVLQDLGRSASRVRDLVEDLAGRLEAGELKPDGISAVLEELATRNEALFGLGIAFVPGALNGDSDLYAPYVMRTAEGTWKKEDVGTQYDYTDQRLDWYRRPLHEGQVWLEPHMGVISGRWLVQYATPFSLPEAKEDPAGIVLASIALRGLQERIAGADLPGGSYAFLVSSSARFLAHPDMQKVRGGDHLLDLVDPNREGALNQAFRTALAGGEGIAFRPEDNGGMGAVWLLRPVPGAPWVLGVVLPAQPEEEQPAD